MPDRRDRAVPGYRHVDLDHGLDEGGAGGKEWFDRMAEAFVVLCSEAHITLEIS
jgi:hypothetical protein